jgi:hypothetical protein
MLQDTFHLYIRVYLSVLFKTILCWPVGLYTWFVLSMYSVHTRSILVINGMNMYQTHFNFPSGSMMSLDPPSDADESPPHASSCAAIRSSHAVAGQGHHLDFAVAKLGLEALLGSCNVATYSHPIEKQAAAGEFKLASAKFKFKQ